MDTKITGRCSRFNATTRLETPRVPRLVKIMCVIAAVCWLAMIPLVVGGCAASTQADTHARVAELSDSAADRIDAGLAALPDGDADAPVNPDAVRSLLPADWQAAFDRLVASGRSAVDAAAEIKRELRVIAFENRAAEAAIRSEIAAGGDRWVLAATQIGAAATGINPAVGPAITLVSSFGAGIAAWKGGKRKHLAEGARQTAEIVNAGRFADPELNARFKTGTAHDAMRSELAKADPIVAKAVRDTKHE